MRTTLDIDDPVLKDLKRLQKRQGKSLGRLVSDLLAQALASTRVEEEKVPPFSWVSRPMAARFDLRDKQALRDAMDDADR
jgi:hypothetical protein